MIGMSAPRFRAFAALMVLAACIIGPALAESCTINYPTTIYYNSTAPSNGVGGAIGAYDALVRINGSTIEAIDSEGTPIANGTAGTDDAAVFNAAINALGSGTTLAIGGGDYTPTSRILINKSLDIIGIGNPRFTWNYAVAHYAMFSCSGSNGGLYALASDVAEGDRTLTYAGDLSSIIDAGDLITISDNTIWQPGSSGTYATWKTGEIHMVRSVSYSNPTTTITLDDGLLHNFTTAQGATMQHRIPITVNIDGITVAGDDPDRAIYLISCDYCKDGTFEGITAERVGGYGICFTSSYNMLVTGSTFRDMTSGVSNLGYGVSVSNDCAYITVTDSHFDNCGHGVTAGGTGPIGQPRDILVTDSSFIAGTSSAIDAHQITESMTVDGNTIGGVYIYGGILSGARTSIIRNNKVWNTDTAIGPRGTVSNRTFIVQNNLIDNAENGIFTNIGEPNSFDTLIITGNVFKRILTHDIDISVAIPPSAVIEDNVECSP
ncbi:MAG: right-handed parallel beta-helix repeat-containing protein [bacterium]